MSKLVLPGCLPAGLLLALPLLLACGRKDAPSMQPTGAEKKAAEPACSAETGCSGLTWLPIPGGTFEMGCSPGDARCREDEQPRHPVTISPFEMLETEVTESQFSAVTGENPSCRYSRTSGPDMAVECVSFEMAARFCTAVGGRLPTEAEWEFAARGGQTSKYYCGNDDSCLGDIAWYGANSGKQKHDVKGKKPNAFGLFDMLGNVYEWTTDFYAEDYYSSGPDMDPQGPATGLYRVRRGGDFYHYDPNDLSVSSRVYRGPWDGPANLGFRCVRAPKERL